jgi:Methyltransferase small domain
MMNERVTRWLNALEERHLSNLTFGEVARALRALSSCYVERRAKLATGGALETAGKRAAFALFYAPLHLIVAREIVRALPVVADVSEIVDLGCGTGAAGAAWALESEASRIAAIDRHPWAVAEANWTYRTLGLRGRATQAGIGRANVRSNPGMGIMAAYVINELTIDLRARVLERLLASRARGARVLIIEPIARRGAAWWDDWTRAFERAGGGSAEWRFPTSLPPRQQDLARAAGLQPHELTARSLWMS